MKIFCIIAGTIAIALISIAYWVYMPGRYSEANIMRIRTGISLEECNRLLGSEGVEIATVPESSRGPIIRGDRYFAWGDRSTMRGDHLIVGFENGVVKQWYHFDPVWSPSVGP